MRRPSPLLIAAPISALLCTACAVTGLPDQATVAVTTAPPVATLAPTTTPPTTSSPATTTSTEAPPTTLTPAQPASTVTTVDAFTITTPSDWTAASLSDLSPTEAAVQLRPLDNQVLTQQLTSLADAGGIIWAEPADGTGDVTANVLQSAPRPDELDLLAEADDIELQLRNGGAAIEDFVASELIVGENESVRTTFRVVGLAGSVHQTQYLFGHEQRVYVLTFSTTMPERDQLLFASIAESVRLS